MSYLKFDNKQLVNLEYSLQREILDTNKSGSYYCTTLSGCNTRKYHGLLIAKSNQADRDNHVLLSSFDTTIIQQGAEFNLGIHKYIGENYEPKGHKYIIDFEYNKTPKTTFRIGDTILSVELLLVEWDEQILIKYTLSGASSSVKLKLKPFLAFRNVHNLCKSNLYTNTKYENINNGIKMKIYEGYPFLHLQFSKKVEYIHVPDWYYNFEYYKERNRGYDFTEDLFVPGYFEVNIKKGESIVVSASTKEISPLKLKDDFICEFAKKTLRNSFYDCMQNAALQFYSYSLNEVNLIAGFPWHNTQLLQTLIALPGLSYAISDLEIIKKVIETVIKEIKESKSISQIYNFGSADAPLWLFWTFQKLTKSLGGKTYVWENYKAILIDMLNELHSGNNLAYRTTSNGLLTTKNNSTPFTWMNSIVNQEPVTLRCGCSIETNALWYNAISFVIDYANSSNDTKAISKWIPLKDKIGKAIIENFWCDKKQQLADCINNENADWSIRPNQIIAAAMPYSPLSSEMKKAIITIVQKDLLTPRGLRTLSPLDHRYQGTYGGDVQQRDKALHQGTVHPWLIGFFIDCYLHLFKKSGLQFAKQIIEGFESEMTNNCVGTISEVFNGDPPHIGKGAISQAWNVGELMRAYQLVNNYDNENTT